MDAEGDSDGPSGSSSSLSSQQCPHSNLYVDPSLHMLSYGFSRHDAEQRLQAATLDGNSPLASPAPWPLLTPQSLFEDPLVFPGPLVLPGDGLAVDPELWPQSVTDWAEDDQARPVVTAHRRTIYVIRSPDIGEGVRRMEQWTDVPTADGRGWFEPRKILAGDVCDYLSAFYHGLDVQVMSGEYTWVAYQAEGEPAYDGVPMANPSADAFLGLRGRAGRISPVRCRPSPEELPIMQVYLPDVLRVLADDIPRDAFAVMLLLDQDVYDDEHDDAYDVDDDRGETYAAFRACACTDDHAAVLSTYRSHPAFTRAQHARHPWPLSHCARYIESVRRAPSPEMDGDDGEDAGTRRRRRPRRPSRLTARLSGPMTSAVRAAADLEAAPGRRQRFDYLSMHDYAETLGRVVTTATHQAARLFGMDHCPYFACVMQSCGPCGEEALRSPPFVCPVCLEKVARAVAGGSWIERHQLGATYVEDRYRALREVCRRWREGPLFVGFAAWLDAVLAMRHGGRAREDLREVVTRDARGQMDWWTVEINGGYES